MLKVISAILSVYILALSVMPCADGPDSAQDQVHQEMMADHDHSGQEHPPGEDLCTPFCACQCCHTNITFTTYFKLQEIAVPVQAGTTLYSEQAYSTYLTPLLDPPWV